MVGIAEGHVDPYEGYRAVYGIYFGTSGLIEELKPLFQIPGIYPDGAIQVDDEFRVTARTAAIDWLKNNPV